MIEGLTYNGLDWGVRATEHLKRMLIVSSACGGGDLREEAHISASTAGHKQGPC
jgi:hypothetical protein